MQQLKIEGLYKIKGDVLRSLIMEAGKNTVRVTVHMGTCGISSGAKKVYNVLKDEIEKSGRKDIELTTSGCAGICNREPLITVERIGEEAIKYADVDEPRAMSIFNDHVIGGMIKEEWVFARGWEQKKMGFDGPVQPGAEGIANIHEIPFFGFQDPIVMKNRGIIESYRIEEYIAQEGYFAAAKALFQMTPEEIITEVKTSGIRGRGGAGYPTGLKWSFAASSIKEGTKYVLCNADEGDPGAFMDRCVLESDPHAILEGMIIAARAIGSHQGYIYCRAEYPLAVKTLNHAIGQAREFGLLGKNIMGSGFDFDIDVYRGAGAFVCGEETALMTSIEGKRGVPRPRPPFPAIQGLWKKPTILNNVETLANIPQIILNGGKWYAGRGTQRSKGTKVFALTGDVKNVGLVEVPMGISIGTIIHDIGGGIPNKKRFKAVQLGGPSGGCVPVQHLNTPVDYESIIQLGAIVGSGGMIVMDEDKCVVDVARYFMEFCKEESCGKCAPCRVGTVKMLEILTRICEGRGREDDIERLERWANIIKNTALCGLGQTAPNPVLSTLRYFRDEYEAHIKEKRCPAVVCNNYFKSPCMHACPIEMDIPSYVSLVRVNRLEDAYKVLLKTNPFPSICGRVCDHQCETKCRRSSIDEAVGIKYIKRFITDNAVRPKVKKVTASRKERIAIIGAGPAGLTAGRDLSLKGYAVTVFERLSTPGGMLRWGIPEYRLPRDILDREIKDIVDLGVDIRLNTRVGKSESEGDILWDTIATEYSAVYLAIGAQNSAMTGIEGEDLDGVWGAIDFLRQINDGAKVEIGKHVAVVGGGNSAIDAARCAIRRGAEKVTILYRRMRSDMPALEEEIKAAEEEGVSLQFMVAPIRYEGTNFQVKNVICRRMEMGEFDNNGRRKPIPRIGDEFSLDVDQVILAIGQAPVLPFESKTIGMNTTKDGYILIEKGNKSLTSAPMIFAGGDAVTGPNTVVSAIAAGHKAACEIDEAIRKITGEPAATYEEEMIDIPMTVEEEIHEIERSCIMEVDCKERIKDFREVELGLKAEDAIKEASRCLRCDVKDIVSDEEEQPVIHAV